MKVWNVRITTCELAQAETAEDAIHLCRSRLDAAGFNTLDDQIAHPRRRL